MTIRFLETTILALLFTSCSNEEIFMIEDELIFTSINTCSSSAIMFDVKNINSSKLIDTETFYVYAFINYLENNYATCSNNIKIDYDGETYTYASDSLVKN